MPRYYFNVYDGKVTLDPDGMELSDTAQARRMAVRMAGQIFDDDAELVALGEDWHMEVVDETGLLLFRLDFVVTDAPALGVATERP